MALIDLRKFSGLALAFDGSALVEQEKGIEIGSRQIVSISDMRSQILNPELSCPSTFYYIFSKIDRKSLLKRKNLRYDMYVVPANLAGIEYVKTSGLTCGKYPVLLDVTHGYVTIILQANCDKGDSILSYNSCIVRLARGDKYVIPPNHEFVIINTRRSLSVVSMIYSSKGYLKRVLDDTRGISSYIIRKNARLETVRNPFFRDVKMINPWKPNKIYKNFSLTAKTPIFKQILRKYPRFKWLHDASKVDWSKLPCCK